ncbi:hypothetical protein NDU88_003205 [Pleurodeles waltl]|uniref:Uncharacterized protein n=1 Tax=Pleurodeles waltl TaxID=8319 RepID=A0AAV7WSE8_PLEWA|nr:hypothetical protein NDU88_003205 [Pleurodeles waltl]
MQGPLHSSVTGSSLATTERPSAPIHEQPLRYFFHQAGRSGVFRFSSPDEQRPPDRPSFRKTSTSRSGEPGLPSSLTPPSKQSAPRSGPRLQALITPGGDNPPRQPQYVAGGRGRERPPQQRPRQARSSRPVSRVPARNSSPGQTTRNPGSLAPQAARQPRRQKFHHRFRIN